MAFQNIRVRELTLAIPRIFKGMFMWRHWLISDKYGGVKFRFK